jgi:integrase
MGLGSLGVVTLAEARLAAADCRRLLHEGVDPIAARNALAVEAATAAAKSITFKDCAATYIEKHRGGWRSPKHATQWVRTLATYAEPIFGHMPVNEIDTGLVLRVLEPIWSEKTETASRLRGRIELILDWATVRGYRTGENPARWRGHLKSALPNRSKSKKPGRYAALPYGELGEFMAALRAQDGLPALLLEFTILGATRTGESIGALWSEIDRAAEVWKIPGERTKSGKEHRVPLTAPMLAIVDRLATLRVSEFAFPGVKAGRPLSKLAMRDVLMRMKRQDITVHGFRSTFRDWAGDQTAYPKDVAEMALGHAIANQVEAAYRRGDMLEKRRRLLDEWATFCGTVAPKGASVVPMRRAGA